MVNKRYICQPNEEYQNSTLENLHRTVLNDQLISPIMQSILHYDSFYNQLLLQ